MVDCVFCGEHNIERILDFGKVALAGAFLKPSQFEAERCYPLRLNFCPSCCAVQVEDRIDRETLFREYFYFTSAIGTMRDHFKAYASEVAARFNPETVLEIGCNDGVLAKPLADLGVKVIAVDPAANVTAKIDDPRITVRNEFFGQETVKAVGKVDMVVANNVYAHIGAINETTAAIADILTDDGVFIFEVNRLDSLLSDVQYDWIYHEHLYYFSQIALTNHLARHGMEIFDCRRLATHAGSMRYFACKTGKRPITRSVIKQREYELWMGLDGAERMHFFAGEAQRHMLLFRETIENYWKAGKRIAGYGACGRTNTLLQASGIGKYVRYIVDDAPAKQGFYTPGTHIPIMSRNMLDDDPPDVLIVFAWSFLSEIERKLGKFKGEVIVPLPTIYIPKKALAA